MAEPIRSQSTITIGDAGGAWEGPDAPPAALLRISDLTASELNGLVDAAAAARRPRRTSLPRARGDLVVGLFEGPSPRTRAAFAGAAHRLGLEPLLLTVADTHIRDGESVADTVRTLGGAAAAIVLRLQSHASVEEAAAASPAPAINAGSGEHDPCHVLADLLALRDRFGSLPGLRVAYVGADRAVSTSLAEAGDLLGMQVVVAPPPTPTHHPDAFGRTVESHGIDPRDAVRGAHAIYTDAWVRGGDQARNGGGLWDAATHEVTAELLALAGPGAVVLHRLPLHRGQEIAAGVADGERSLIWAQSANRLPAAVAVLQHVLAAVPMRARGLEPPRPAATGS